MSPMRPAPRLLDYLPLALVLLIAGVASAPESSEAKVYASRKEAISLAFPDADRVEEKTFLLDDDQHGQIERLAQTRIESRLVTVYSGFQAGTLLGHAIIDVHTVRTLPEAFLVVMSPQGEVRQLRLLAFYEPPEYAPSDRWLAQFDRRGLDRSLRLEGAIHGIAGSTLTARAVTGGVRRALAFYEVLLQERVAASGVDGHPSP